MNSLISLARKNTIANALFKTFSLFQSNFSHGNLLKPNFIQQQQRTFSCLFQDLNKSLKSSRLNLLSPNLFVVPSCGMKVKGELWFNDLFFFCWPNGHSHN